jgi:8-oxo-dGTP diphosphatase
VPPAGPSPYVLLTRRNLEPFKEQWCLPGGHINRYEAAIDAVRREVSEETNLEFHPQFFAYFDEIIEPKVIHAVVLAFDGYATGTPRPSPDEVLAMRWFSMDAARQMPLAFRHNEILDAYAAHLVSADPAA